MNRLDLPFVTLLGLAVTFLPARAPAEPVTNQFHFRLPTPAAYRLDADQAPTLSAASRVPWLKAWPADGGTNWVELGSRIVVQLKSTGDLKQLTANHALTLSRTVAPNVFVLQAPDALTAAREAHRLAALAEVAASYPILRQPVELNGPYAYQPTEKRYSWEWNLENRNSDGSSAGMDLNVRAAWPYTQGQGVTVAIADTGVEMAHPELAARVAGAPHYNFADDTTNAGPVDQFNNGAHGTECAGLVAASLNNGSMVGIAPQASLASWVIFHTNFVRASDEELMDMYQYQSNVVSVQSHSWTHPGRQLQAPTLLEQIGISNAVSQGRAGRGVVMVRAAGNDRLLGANADDDGYPADPRVIAVAAARAGGRVASYSEPGACLLVAAPSGDADNGFAGIFTTDLLSTNGVTQLRFFPPYDDLCDYAWGNTAFSGTSAAAPQIAGIVALILSANPNLTYRDVQQILILASRHFDVADPDLVINGAGFQVSHNLGFGVPDAGVAVNLARNWVKRPPATSVTLTNTHPAAIPDDGLRVLITGTDVPANLTSIHTLPSVGPQADTPTLALPLADFGYGTNLAGFNLTNKAALIQRGPAAFADSITLAAKAGAAFAVVYNYPTNTSGSGAPGGDQLIPMGATDFVPIPAVFIGHSDGEALKNLFATNNIALAQIRLNATSYVFSVTNTLICEHVGLRVMTDHSVRGDLRITLVSPAGTRSVLQRYNGDTSPGPVDWTYYSTHHFFESSAGTWTAYFADEGAGATGSVQLVSLTIEGVPIQDQDKDGLDDAWEMAYAGNLALDPWDDPDYDGYSNAREQLMGTNPTVPENQFPRLDFSRFNATLGRLSWPSRPYCYYEVWGGTNVDALQRLTNMPARFPETEWFTPSTPARQFFRVRVVPGP